MASSADFVAYIADQLAPAGHIVCKKMFGDYGVYCDGKIFALICDNQLFVKITAAGKEMLPQGVCAAPYPGAKPYFLIDAVDDREFLCQLTAATCRELPPPKPKKNTRAAL